MGWQYVVIIVKNLADILAETLIAKLAKKWREKIKKKRNKK